MGKEELEEYKIKQQEKKLKNYFIIYHLVNII